MKVNILRPIFKFALFAGCTIGGTVNAQTSQSLWSMTLEAGPSFSSFGGDSVISGNKTGFLGGVGITYSKSSMFAITGKALYHQKGNTMDAGSITSSLRLDYIEVPLIARFFLNKEGRFRPNLFVGPTFSYLLNKDYETDATIVSLPAGTRTSDFNRFDFGLTGGIGLNYRIKNDFRILLDGRYNYGISDILKTSGHVNNMGVAVTLGVSFAICNNTEEKK